MFSQLRVIAAVYGLVASIVEGQGANVHSNFTIAGQSFNLNVDGGIIDDPLTKAKTPGIVTSDAPQGEQVHTSPARLIETILTDIADLEFKPVGTKVAQTYSLELPDGGYVNANVTLVRLS